jgi:hypothetical protein
MEKHELVKLESKIKELNDVCREIGDESNMKEMLLIIRRPGWTTPAELALVNVAVESLINQVRAVNSLRESLVAGARQVEAGRGTTA